MSTRTNPRWHTADRSRGRALGGDRPPRKARMDIKIEDVTEVRNRKISANGQIYVGNEYAGERVQIAVKVLDDDQEEGQEEDTDD